MTDAYKKKLSIKIFTKFSFNKIALLWVQRLAHGFTRLRFKNLVKDSSNNNLASGLLLGMISLSFGILNTTCITSYITYGTQ
ncbi:conserved hypothetical protein [Moraxellaceae bacterium 17A]|nr:conserved hypothetical protein [Moraxellaceae bacterium 17A]